MKKKTVYNPYGIHGQEGLFNRLLFLATFGAALVGTLFFFLLSQILQANGAPLFLKEFVYYFGEIISAASLFTLLALTVVSVSREEKTLFVSLVKKEALALFCISCLMRVFLYWLTALVDDKLGISFYFNDTPLSTMLANNGLGLWAWGLYTVLSAFAVVLTILLTYYLSRTVYRRSGKRGETPPFLNKLPSLIYLGITLISAIVGTVYSLIVDGFAFEASVIVDLVMPYVELALFSLAGYYYVSYLTALFKRKGR